MSAPEIASAEFIALTALYRMFLNRQPRRRDREAIVREVQAMLDAMVELTAVPRVHGGPLQGEIAAGARIAQGWHHRAAAMILAGM